MRPAGQRHQRQRGGVQEEGRDQGRADPEAARDRLDDQRAEERADAADREQQPHLEWREPELAGQEEQQQRDPDVDEEGAGAAGERERAQDRVAPEHGQPFADLGPGAGLRLGWRWRRLLVADQRQRDGRDEEGDGVDRDRDRRGQELDQPTGQAEAGHLGDRVGRLQAGVGLDQRLAPDQRRQVGPVGDVEEGRQDADQQRDQVELLDAERAEQRRDGDREGQQEAPKVGPDHDRAPPQPVDPDAGEQADQQRRGHVGDVEQAHLERRRVQRHRGDEQEGEAADQGAEERDRLPRPQLQKVGLTG